MRGCTIVTFVRVIAVALLAAKAVVAAPQPKQKSKGVAIPLAKRNSFLHPNNTVNFGAVDAHSASVSAKIIRGLYNYEKNTGTTHPSVLEQRFALDGALPLKMYNNVFWYATLSIGSPPKEFNVEIDTGCADLFVPSVGGDAITQQHTVLDPSLSSTANNLNRQFKIAFSDGAAVSGTQYTDKVTLASFSADEQTIGVALTYSSNMETSYFTDGLLGLAFQSISNFPASPFFETLIKENKVSDPVFSFHLSASGGELFLGGTNEALYKKDTLTYVEVTHQGYWQIEMDEIQGNGKTIASKVDVIVDSGANLIYGDKMQVYRLHKALGGKLMKFGWHSLPCKADPEPSVILTFGGKPFQIPIEMLRLGPISDGSPYCFSSIRANIAPVSFWTIGAPFLESVYTVFGHGTGPSPIPRVGFAELA